MLVAERHIIKKGHRFWAEIDNLSWQSKNLYNSAQNLCPFLIMCLSATNIIVRCLLTQRRVLKGCYPL